MDGGDMLLLLSHLYGCHPCNELFIFLFFQQLQLNRLKAKIVGETDRERLNNKISKLQKALKDNTAQFRQRLRDKAAESRQQMRERDNRLSGMKRRVC